MNRAVASSAAAEGAPGRRELIVAKSAELFARQTIAGTTVREISEAAGILSGSLYHYFDSKDAIIDVIMGAFLDDVLEQYRGVLARSEDVKERFQGLVTTSLQAVDRHPSAATMYQTDTNYFRDTDRFRYVRIGAEQVRTTWMATLEAGVTEGVFRSDLPTRTLYLLLRDSLWLTVRWFRPTSAYGYDDLAADCCHLYYQGFASTETLRSILGRRAAGIDARSAPPTPATRRRGRTGSA